MSAPTNDILQELISAQSALNMEPDPIKGRPGRFLSECDGWARHSMTHITHATKLMLERTDLSVIGKIIDESSDTSVAAQRIINLIRYGHENS